MKLLKKYLSTCFIAIPLHWVGIVPQHDTPVTLGIPFAPGELKSSTSLVLADAQGKTYPSESWTQAYWPDGSVKWAAVSALAPSNNKDLQIIRSLKKSSKNSTKKSKLSISPASFTVTTGKMTAYFSLQGKHVIDSIYVGHQKVTDAVEFVTDSKSPAIVDQVLLEHQGPIRTIVRVQGHLHQKKFPFDVRLYFYQGSDIIKLVNTLTIDAEPSEQGLKAIGIRAQVPLREQLYNRHVAFTYNQGKVWSESVQPLDGRRVLTLQQGVRQRAGHLHNLQVDQVAGKRIPEYKAFDKINQNLIDNWAKWDEYRLSQITDNACSIQKKANSSRPWLGTFTTEHGDGYAFVGDVSGGLGLFLKDFWQSYPSAFTLQNMRSYQAQATVWLWSPYAEPMDLRHYDDVAHDLNASYEDVQPGLSTPVGIARTSVVYLQPSEGYQGQTDISTRSQILTEDAQLLPTPEYLHEKRAFGIWSLPDSSTANARLVEKKLEHYIQYYQQQVKQYKWYGFWNYGDFMHAFDEERGMWRYDVGGYAWDNTELGTPLWLWYSFLRSGRKDIWDMAVAMTRHNAEVDVYHLGPWAGLGSRHNVSHWGCGAKEARISQVSWNRFLYYLTADERTGDLMHAVKDADQKLYELDPMRLAEPRSKYPSTAPARLRIGPDWVSYVANWMTEWERTGNTVYRDKIIAGMKSIGQLPHGLFTGNKALGYDPATGKITYEGDPKRQNTNHLLSIMGGFETINELSDMIKEPTFYRAWYEHARDFERNSQEISGNHQRIIRLEAYAAHQSHDTQLATKTWNDLLGRHRNHKAGQKQPTISTNEAASWSLAAIYTQEVLKWASPDTAAEKPIWIVESESPYHEIHLGDTIDIKAPKGLTLWYTQKLKAPVTITYQACIVDEGKVGDRLSDLNCFWMATDPQASTIFDRMDWRQGNFLRSYSLKQYYLGFGGNSNTTTRFRLYDGNDNAEKNAELRPAIIKEYTDQDHLLKANHWYTIRIVVKQDSTAIYFDGEKIADYQGKDALTSGWFGIRTTQAHLRFTSFQIQEHNF